MKYILFFLVCFTTTSLVAKESILITSFEPFGGKSSNNSINVAYEIKNLLKYNNEIDISLCILPVVYDIAAKKTIECIKKLKNKPKIILSLGEVGCKIRFEDKAKNRDYDPGTADNKFQVRNNREIIKNGPKEIKFNLPIQQMYCAEKDPDIRDEYFTASKHMGGFVCNNTAYILAKTLSAQYQYGFIHVPREECKDIGNPRKIAQFIVKGILTITKKNKIKNSNAYTTSICLKNSNEINPLKARSNLALKNSLAWLADAFCIKEYDED